MCECLDADRVEDESTRYVAEENVILLPKHELEAMGQDGLIEAFPIEIGKWFRRWEWDERIVDGGRFVSNIRGEYPED